MRHTVRVFIVALVSGGMAAAFLLLGLVGGSLLDQRLLEDKQTEMSLALTLMSRSAEGGNAPDSVRDEFRAWAEIMKTIGGYYRLTLIDHQGRVLDDSRNHLTDLDDSRAGRPEVIQALKQGLGSSRRYCATDGRDYLFVAVRISDRRSPDLPPMALRLGLPLDEVRAARNEILKHYALGAVLMVILAGLGAALAAGPLNRDIKELTSAARDLADGRLERRLVRQPKNELIFLGLALNRLASRFSRQARRDRADRERLLAVLENMAEGVLVIDAAGRITNSNPALARLFHLEQAPAGGFPGEFIRQPGFIEALSRVGRGEIIPPLKLNLPVYPPQTVEVRLRPLGDEYQPEGVVAVFHKI